MNQTELAKYIAGTVNSAELRSALERQWTFLRLPRVLLEANYGGQFYRCTVDSAEQAWEAAEGAQKATAVYVLPQAVEGYHAPEWGTVYEVGAVRTEMISTVTTTYLDIDVRKSDARAMATAAEVAEAQAIARLLYRHIAAALGSETGLAYCFSGNGAQIWIAHAPIAAAEALPLRVELVRAVKALYGDFDKRIDTTIANIRRIGPLAGTWKRKSESIADRPHRPVGFWCDAPGEITADQFRALVSYFSERAPAPPQEAKPARAKVDLAELGLDAAENIFEIADALDVDHVARLCGGPGTPWCFVCKIPAKYLRSKTGRKVYGCHHYTCMDVRPGRASDPSRPTIWGPLNIVMHTQGMSAPAAYDWLHRQGLVPPRVRTIDLLARKLFGRDYQKLTRSQKQVVKAKLGLDPNWTMGKELKKWEL